MSKKLYRPNKKHRSDGYRADMVTIPREKFEELVNGYVEAFLVRMYLLASTTPYADADTIRLMLGIKKES